MERLIMILMGVGWIATIVASQIYRMQRDDLATAWVYFHPDDFPTEDDE